MHPDNGTCPLSASDKDCGDFCQLWMDKESCCAIHSIAHMLKRLSDSLSVMADIFEKEAA